MIGRRKRYNQYTDNEPRSGRLICNRPRTKTAPAFFIYGMYFSFFLLLTSVFLNVAFTNV